MKFTKTAQVGAAALAFALAVPAMAYQDADTEEMIEEPAEEAAEAAMETAEEAAETVMEAEAPAKPANVAPEGSPHFIPAPPPGKGQIVFYRSSAMGFAVGCTVNQGDKDNKVKISSVGSGRYVIVTADPGKQEYWTKSEAKDALTVLVEEGETQYVECRIKMGFMVGRPDLSPSDAAEFVEKGAKLKMVDDDDMGEGALRSTDLAAMQ
ncbi:hypothetical protein [Altererythrobacter sp. GH1-8]|uniref:hypothetical protein n=1 Tax=Altererythrobacter sp. GH1-8 TaxID=3349333 RepID=UPI00374DDDB4